MELILDYRGLELRIDEPERQYFEAASAGRLILQVCAGCRLVRYPPAPRCTACGSGNWSWQETTGRGRAYACVVVEHSVRDTFPAPYAIGLVEMDDVADANPPAHAVRILSTLLELDGVTPLTDVLPDGTPVVVSFRMLAEGYALPEFKLASA